MIGLLIGIAIVTATMAVAVWRMSRGPRDADRVAASDLLFFGVIALFALVGAWRGFGVLFDVVLVATVVGMLATVSLSRAMTKGRR